MERDIPEWDPKTFIKLQDHFPFLFQDILDPMRKYLYTKRLELSFPQDGEGEFLTRDTSDVYTEIRISCS